MSVVVVNASGNQDIDGILWGWSWGQTNLTLEMVPVVWTVFRER